ncbi:hypothetical protein [Funiculus sociatus]|uniref:hypothetical protein n=1 Tax=Funiculus sociatus TaxID=450527 RepID=UPI00329858A8
MDAIAFCLMSAIAHSFPANFDRIACHTSICCCNCWMRSLFAYGVRSLIHSLPTLTASLVTPQSAAVIVGCDRFLLMECDRSFIPCQL